MAKKKETGTALVKWEDKFAGFVKQNTADFAAPGGKFISFKGGVMKFGGAKVPGNKLNCIIVGAIYENVYFDPEEGYDPENPNSPLCYAFGTAQAEMMPHDNVEDKQNSQCQSCPMNQFGSGRKGKGKGCSNRLRLALIMQDQLSDDLDAVEVVYARVPVMSVANWKKHINDLGAINRPYWAVVTEISLEDDDKTQFQVHFSIEEKIEDTEYFDPLEALWEKSMGAIAFPYAKIEKKEPAKPAKGGKAGGPRKNKFAA